jgi:hypothetical protein
VKTPQVLMRDRLQCNYIVKPTVARLKRTLIGLGGEANKQAYGAHVSC